MVIDTSAIVAIIFEEDDMRLYAAAIENARSALISAPTLVETCVVVERDMGPAGEADLDAFLVKGRFDIVPFDARHLVYAREAFRLYGKGRHPAGLNLGDCFSYALSKATGEPLLYKGDDFARTDVVSALQPEEKPWRRIPQQP